VGYLFWEVIVSKKKSTRKLVTQDEIKRATDYFHKELARRIAQKGQYSHITPHETLGLITEEYHEVLMAVHMNNSDEFAQELTDVAVGCIFGLASHYARNRRKAKNPNVK
jgi:NTP pyrophosphatase (non-canonical NTP hydrolase)